MAQEIILLSILFSSVIEGYRIKA